MEIAMLRSALNHRKFRRLAAILGITRFAAVGLAECLWHLTATQAPQGDIGKLSDAEIAEGVFWPKRSAAKLIDALASPEVSLVDRCKCHRLRVHDWNCHADQSVKKTLSKNRKSFCLCYSPDPRSGTIPEQERNGSGLPEPEPEPEPIEATVVVTPVDADAEKARGDLRAELTRLRDRSERHRGKSDQQILDAEFHSTSGGVVRIDTCTSASLMRATSQKVRAYGQPKPSKPPKPRKGDPWGGEPDEAQAMLELRASEWLTAQAFAPPRHMADVRGIAAEAPEIIRGAVTMILFARNPHLRDEPAGKEATA